MTREIVQERAPTTSTYARAKAPRRPGTVCCARRRSAAAASSGWSTLTPPILRTTQSSKPDASTLSGSITTLTRCSAGFRHGYSSLPRYFFASLSIWASAPDSVTLAGPLTATHLYVLFGSTTSSEARGSFSRCSVFARPRAVLNETLPSSTSTQTIVECGEPSARNVVAVATNGFSSRNFRCFSPSFAIPTSRCFGLQRLEPSPSSPLAAPLPVGNRKGAPSPGGVSGVEPLSRNQGR